MTRWSLFLQTLSLLHHFLGLYFTVMFTGYAFILATVGLIRRLPLVRWASMGNRKPSKPARQGPAPRD